MLGVVAAAVEPIAGGRHKVFGRKELAIIPMTSTIASHLPRAVGMALAIDRAARLGVPCPWSEDAIVLCSFGDASLNHATAQAALNTTAQMHVPGPAAAASLRVRGQRPRDQRSDARRAGSSPRSPRGRRSATRSRTGTIRPRCSGSQPSSPSWVRERRTPAVLHLRTRALPEPRGRGRRDGVPDAAGRSVPTTSATRSSAPRAGSCRQGARPERSSRTTTSPRATRCGSSRSRSPRSRR